MVLSSIWNWNNKVADLCRRNIAIFGCVGQPYKETYFSKWWLLEFTKFIEQGIKNLLEL